MNRFLSDGTVQSAYNPAALPLLRALPGARWNPNQRCWHFSLAAGDRKRVCEIAEQLGYEIDPALAKVELTSRQQFARSRITALYPFQLDGAEFLAGKERVLLADEMGLGKTVQALATILPTDATLVVCPKSAKYTWQAEIRRWRPDLTVRLVSGKQKTWAALTPNAGEVVIANFDILPQAPAPPRCAVIVDEAHRVKNYKAARTKKVTALCHSATRVIFLTGTPLENKPLDLWGVLQAGGMAREVFGGWNKFVQLFHGYQEQVTRNVTVWQFGTPQPEAAERLRRCSLRRRRNEVLPDLPQKIYQEIVCNDLPAALERELDEWLDIGTGNDLPDFSEFSTYRMQLATARIPAMLEIVEDYESAGTPLVVFSAHRAPVDALAERDGWLTITGDISNKQAVVDRFQQDSSIKGIALTIRAGGLGLTLTRASHELFVDLEWAPSANSQAEDRCVRIGQQAQSVHVSRMVSSHPLDRHIQSLLVEKMRLIDAAIDSAIAPETLVSKPERPKRPPFPDADKPAVKRALEFLDSRCDGAAHEDGKGFNKIDTAFGKSLAQRETLTDAQYYAALKIIQKYRKQLERAGL